MEWLSDPASFDFFARSILSGFVIFAIRQSFVGTERPKLGEAIFDILVLSLINQLIWRLVVGAAGLVAAQSWGAGLLVVQPWIDGFSLYLEVLVLPLVLGLLFAQLLQAQRLQWLQRLIGLPMTSPRLRAFDEVFSGLTEPKLIIVTYEDGTQVYGYYGSDSFAGRDPSRSEIYLERIYDFNETDGWAESTPTRGVLLQLNGLQSIEFVDLEPRRRENEENPD